ncbi:MAG: TauD/TfdA family dioxygenase [Alphaproteobacteria bacterium]|nr:TauD/TfdA family dioxygenase [Alphaproteobacteria bacterium]
MTTIAATVAAVQHPLHRPITGPSAWTGAQMRRRDDWIRPFTAPELAEIDAALATVRAKGLDIADITAGNFPLATLGPALLAIRDEVLNGRGFILLRGLPVERYDMAGAATVYFGIGAYLGKARSQNAQGHLLGHVRDQGLDVKDPNVRVYQTRERQTFHTDSCDIVGLLCLKTAKSGGLGSIVSSMTIYNRMAAEHPDLLLRLCRPMTTDRRGEVPEGERPYFALPVFNSHAGHLSVIYARRYIESGQRFPEVPRLTPQDLAALDEFDRLANDDELRLDMEFRPGDMQFVHNHTILHDRTEYVDWPEPERKRHLLRLWLSPPVGRPLPPAYAARYGSVAIGDRGGIICHGTRPHAPLEPV